MILVHPWLLFISVHQWDLELSICCLVSPLFSLKDGTIKRYYLTTKYAVHFISGTVEGNDARQSCGRVTNLNTHRSHYSDGTKLQSEDVHSQVIDILSHSLGLLSSALSAADWLFRNTKEGTPVTIITTLSEAFGIEGFTISSSWSRILKQWREFNKGGAVAFLVDEWVTPDVGNSRQG